MINGSGDTFFHHNFSVPKVGEWGRGLKKLKSSISPFHTSPPSFLFWKTSKEEGEGWIN